MVEPERTAPGCRRTAVACLLALAACTVQSSTKPAVLRFSAIPDANTTELAEKYDVVARYLADALGIPVEYVPAADYSASVEAFRNGDVQLAWFGGLTGAQARAAVPGARAIAQGRIDPAFKSYFVAHASTALTLSETFPMELAGMRFTFGSDTSTSGRLMPEYFIRQNTQQSPPEFFGAPNTYSGNHDNTAKLVEAGTFQAGALSYKRYDAMVAEGLLEPELCRVIWVTPEYPDYNWTAHPVLDERFGPGTIDRLQAALVAARDPALLAAMQREEGLIEATNADFQPIHDIAVELEFLR